MTLVRFPVAVIVQRKPLASRWAAEHWEPLAVETMATEPTGAHPVRIAGDASGECWRFGGHMIELHRSEAEGYFLNVTAPEPKVFVMWHASESVSAPPIVPVIVTVSYNEAARMLDGGDCVDAVPMPPEIRALVESYVAAHYRPEPKRKVRRNDPFGDDARRREDEPTR